MSEVLRADYISKLDKRIGRREFVEQALTFTTGAGVTILGIGAWDYLTYTRGAEEAVRAEVNDANQPPNSDDLRKANTDSLTLRNEIHRALLENKPEVATTAVAQPEIAKTYEVLRKDKKNRDEMANALGRSGVDRRLFSNGFHFISGLTITLGSAGAKLLISQTLGKLRSIKRYNVEKLDNGVQQISEGEVNSDELSLSRF